MTKVFVHSALCACYKVGEINAVRRNDGTRLSWYIHGRRRRNHETPWVEDVANYYMIPGTDKQYDVTHPLRLTKPKYLNANWFFCGRVGGGGGGCYYLLLFWLSVFEICLSNKSFFSEVRIHVYTISYCTEKPVTSRQTLDCWCMDVYRNVIICNCVQLNSVFSVNGILFNEND